MPGLVAVRAAWERRGVGFLAVSVVPDARRVREAAEHLGFDLPQALTTGNLLEAVDITGVPATLFVSGEGRLVGVAEGEISAKELDRQVRALVGG